MTNVDRDLFLHNLSIVTIIKNEAKYLNEWLEFHLLAGVDHFYIYDNNSTDNTKEILQPYIDKGIVEYFFDNEKYIQPRILDESLGKFGFYSRFIMYTDVDEFLVPRDVEITLDEIINRLNTSLPGSIGVIGFGWVNFGSNGQTKADYSKGVLERFNKRNDKYDVRLTKRIINPRRVERFMSAHTNKMLSSFKTCLMNHMGSTVSKNPRWAKLHHYRIKSYEEFLNKRARGSNFHIRYSAQYTDEFFKKNDTNIIEDNSAYEYMKARQIVGYTIPEINYDSKLKTIDKNLGRIELFNDKDLYSKYEELMETYLTMIELLLYMNDKKIIDQKKTDIYIDKILDYMYKTLSVKNKKEIGHIDLFIRTLPRILNIDSKYIEDIKMIYPQKYNLEKIKTYIAEKHIDDYLYQDLLEILNKETKETPIINE